MTRKILVVVNQRKLHRRRRFYDQVLERLRAQGHEIVERAVVPSSEGIALDVSSGDGVFDQVVVAGGDGTVNRVLQSWSHGHIPLAIVPMGTCNLIATECGYSADVNRVAQIIAANRTRPFYVARANGQAYAVAAGCGIDSFVADSFAWHWKKRLGRVYVVWKSLTGVLRYRAPRFEVRVDGAPISGTSVFVLKGRYYGGRFSISRESSLFGPCLHSAINEHTSPWHQLAMIVAVFTGNTRRVSELLTITRAREVEILAPAGFPVQLDGEVRLKTPVRIVLSNEPFLMCVSEAGASASEARHALAEQDANAGVSAGRFPGARLVSQAGATSQAGRGRR